MKIGIICPSEIAIRRFMPALQLTDSFEFAGIGICSRKERFGREKISDRIVNQILETEYEKAKVFVDQYGGEIFRSYEDIVRSYEIEAIYIPLPPALHYQWAKLALETGKHVLIEKPATTNLKDTQHLIKLASEKQLALHENYMFNFHSQIDVIDEIIKSGEIGELRLLRISFGFPKRTANDFRYSKALGGGALIDAGGYTIKYAARLLGDTAKLKYSYLNTINGYEVDMYGSAAMINDDGLTAQIAFGMDNNYKCELEAWGSKGCLTTGRVLTAPPDFVPTAVIRKGNQDKVIQLPMDDSFKKSIEYFESCINDENYRKSSYENIKKQAELVEQFKLLASGNQ